MRSAAGTHQGHPPAIITLAIASLVLGAAAITLVRHPTPFEDAAMLLRYARHVADGHGVVWNVGDAPVDGATDFLYLLLVSAATTLGVPITMAARGLSLIAHLSTVLLLLYGIPALYRVPWWWGVFPAIHVGVGASLAYTAAQFGTPVFGAFVLAAWYCTLRYVRDRDSASAWWLACFGLLAALARPEGVVLSGAFLLAIAAAEGPRAARAPLTRVLVLFGTIGLAYFLWHWQYFGHPLPNPVYRKSLAFPDWDGFVFGVRSVVQMGLPALGVLLLGGASRLALRRTVMVAVPTVLFLAAWLVVSGEMNYLARYQYAIVPMLMLSAPGVVQAFVDALPRFEIRPVPAVRRTIAGVLIAAAAAACWHNYRNFGARGMPADGRKEVGLALQPFANKQYVLVTTEAGLLPLYSTWRTIDAWGFNDAWIAHNGGLTADYLNRQRPDVIMFLADFSPIEPIPPGEGEWFRLRDTLLRYALEGDYVLAAAWGQIPQLTHYYFVRQGNADCRRLVARIREADYRWFQTGRTATDFARVADPAGDPARACTMADAS